VNIVASPFFGLPKNKERGARPAMIALPPQVIALLVAFYYPLLVANADWSNGTITANAMAFLFAANTLKSLHMGLTSKGHLPCVRVTSWNLV
jgi:hypothetical protein